VFEDGPQVRDFVHVSDVAAANVAALHAAVEAPSGRWDVFNVCSGEPVSIRRVADLVAKGSGAGLTPLVTSEYRSGGVRHVVASPKPARTRHGFHAAVLPEEGLREFATVPLRG
jgi:dTDP-L-rhamnose 4-epimerase